MATVEEVYETEIKRTITRRTSFKIEETSSTTKTSTMTTAAKLYGKELSEYDEIDVDQLLSQLSAEEISMLAKEVDPDDSLLPPSQRCSYECEKEPTGPLDRKKLIEHINKQALETPDVPELKPYVPGIIRGKKWIPPSTETLKEKEADEQIAIDLGDEYETALSAATQEEIIDLAAILGFHSMMNQDQYHASLLNKGQPVGLGWDGITKASQPKAFPMEPPNDTDVDKSIQMVKDDSHEMTHLNWNNIKSISDEKFSHLFMALRENTHLETLSLTNVGLMDRHGMLLADALEKNNCLRVLNVETNFLSPPVVMRLVKSLLVQKTIEEFRASNQRSQVLGNKIEMEITQLVEQNPAILRLGLHLEYNDARQRIATHLQRNIDRTHHEKLIRQKQIEVKNPDDAIVSEKPLDGGSIPADIPVPVSTREESQKATPVVDTPLRDNEKILAVTTDNPDSREESKPIENNSVNLEEQHEGLEKQSEIVDVLKEEGQIEPHHENYISSVQGSKVVEHPTSMKPRDQL